MSEQQDSKAARFGKWALAGSALWFAAHAALALHTNHAPVARVWLGGTLLSVAALLLRPVWRVNAALLLLTVIAGLHGFEMRMAWVKPPPATAAAAAGRAWDNRSQIEVVEDVTRSGTPASPTVQAKVVILTNKGPLKQEGAEILPLGVISSERSVFCNEGGAWTQYDADEHGFVNPKGLWSGPVDVALVGDSFTQGACVSPEESFAGVVRATHPRMINLGMGGNGPLLELGGVREYLSRAKPKRVLWLYFRNDLDDLNVEKAVPLLKRYLEPGYEQGLFDRQPQIDAALRALVTKKAATAAQWPARLSSIGLTRSSTPVWLQDLVMGEGHSAAAAVLRLDQLGDLFQTKSGQQQPDFVLFERVLSQARDEVAAWGGQLHFVYLPDLWYLGKRRKDHPLRKRVIESVKKVGLPLLDAHARFEEEQDLEALRYHPLAHYSPKGHALVGHIIDAYLDGL
jgi:hypothetical protein